MFPKSSRQGQARINAYEALLGQESQKRREELESRSRPGRALRNVVIEAKASAKQYGDIS